MKTTWTLAAWAFAVPALAQQPVPEAPSTVNARYVEASAVKALQPGEKIANLYTLNHSQPYVLQRLTARTYWFQRQYYGTTFYVGDKGVLLFDPLEYRAEHILQAIKQVTPLPVTAIVYSHNHGDHIGDAQKFVDAAGGRLRVIASKATKSSQDVLGSKLPKPTERVDWPRGKFKFENLTVEFHGFSHAAHSDDHGAWLLVQEKVLHAPDHMNPDQPPFWAFAGSPQFTYYELNLRQTEKLDWRYFNGGHGNVGSRDDYKFYFEFLSDLKQAVGKAMQTTPFGEGIDPKTINAHTPMLPAWVGSIAKKATEELRPKYGKFYGFETATLRNAELVALSLYDYR